MLEKSKELIRDKEQQQFRLLLNAEVAKVDCKINDDVPHLNYTDLPNPFIKLVAERSEKWSKIIQ